MFNKVSDLQRTVIQVQRCQYMRGEGTVEDPYDLMEEEAEELASKEVIRPVQVEPVVVPAPVPKGQGQTCLKRGPRASMIRASPPPSSYLLVPITEDLAPEDSMSNIGQAQVRERMRVALEGPGPSNWRERFLGGASPASWDRRLAEEWAEEQERLVTGW